MPLTSIPNLPTPAPSAGRPAARGVDHALRANVARVERRVVEYLRTWGLTDEECLRAHARRWTRHVLHEADSHGTPAAKLGATELERRALARAMNSTYLWIARLTRGFEQNGQEAAAGLIALRVRMLLAKHPQAFLRINHLPEEFWRGLRGAGRPVAPHPGYRPMPEQPLGELAPYLAWSFYFDRLVSVAAWCLGRRRPALESAV